MAHKSMLGPLLVLCPQLLATTMLLPQTRSKPSWESLRIAIAFGPTWSGTRNPAGTTGNGQQRTRRGSSSMLRTSAMHGKAACVEDDHGSILFVFIQLRWYLMLQSVGPWHMLRPAAHILLGNGQSYGIDLIYRGLLSKILRYLY